MSIKPPFRYDIVGSFLRPQSLKEARTKFAAGEISQEELTVVEDKSIANLVDKEKEAGLLAVTDGEFRRAMWHLDFLADLTNVKRIDAEQWSVEFKGDKPKGADLLFTGRIGFPKDHPFLKHFDYMKGIAGDTLVKQTIPSPSMLYLIPCVRTTTPLPECYQGNPDLLFADIAESYAEAIREFYAHGCRYLQLDDTSWGEFCDPSKRAAYKERGIDVDEVGRKFVEVINRALEAKPDDMVITMHICRGNFRSTWFSSGGYEPVAPILFAECRVDGFFLEYDSDRSGDFQPLRYIKDQKVVLGLVTSKTPELEKKEDIIARIHEAEKYVPLSQLCLSPQCGFSSTEEGNKLTEEEQWAKVRLVREIAEEVWG